MLWLHGLVLLGLATNRGCNFRPPVAAIAMCSSKTPESKLDEEERVLRNAIESLDSSPDGPASSSYESELRSSTLRDVERLSLEVRSFVQGVRADVERLVDTAGDKLKMESSLAVRIGDYLLRRALLDTSRALTGAANVAVAVLAPAAASSSNASGNATSSASLDDSPAPFAQRSRAISRTRAMSGAAAEETSLLLAAAQEDADVDASAREEWESRDAQARDDAAVVVEELWNLAARQVGEWAGGGADSRQAGDYEPTAGSASLQRLQERSTRLASSFQTGVEKAVRATREDFIGYEQLRQQRALPTYMEAATPELPAPLPKLTTLLPKTMTSLVPPEFGGGVEGGKLRSFAASGDPIEQKQILQQRRDMEKATRRLGLAASIGARASKDAGDTLAFGVLPAATAVGKVAARRILPTALPGPAAMGSRAGEGEDRQPTAAQAASSAAEVVGEIATQLVEEYSKVAAEQSAKALRGSAGEAAGEVISGETLKWPSVASKAAEQAVRAVQQADGWLLEQAEAAKAEGATASGTPEPSDTSAAMPSPAPPAPSSEVPDRWRRGAAAAPPPAPPVPMAAPPVPSPPWPIASDDMDSPERWRRPASWDDADPAQVEWMSAEAVEVEAVEVEAVEVEAASVELEAVMGLEMDVVEAEAAWASGVSEGVDAVTDRQGDWQEDEDEDVVEDVVTSVFYGEQENGRDFWDKVAADWEAEDAVTVEASSRKWAPAPPAPSSGAGTNRAAPSEASPFYADATAADVEAEAADDAEVSIDVDAVSEADAEEVQQKELVELVDAVLFVLETKAAVAKEQIVPSPEAVKDWQMLKNISPEEQRKRRRAEQAEVVLTEAVTRRLERD